VKNLSYELLELGRLYLVGFSDRDGCSRARDLWISHFVLAILKDLMLKLVINAHLDKWCI
jgi:hypothetical protein